MRIINLVAENYKRLVAIDVTPDGHLVDIVGRNGQGKSSLLDSMLAALAGKDAIPSKPIRNGADHARVEAKLGDGSTVSLIVRRTFRRGEDGSYTTQLVVENPDGARYASPQKLLDGLLGALSFDPLAFTRMTAAEQVGELRALVSGVDFEGIQAENDADYEARTLVNRQLKAAQSQLAALKIPADPGARVDESALVAELEQAGEQKAAIAKEHARRQRISDELKRLAREALDATNRAREARQKAEELLKIAAEAEKLAQLAEETAERKAAEFGELAPLQEPDTGALMTRIQEARRTNAAIDERERVVADAAKLRESITTYATKAETFTTRLEQRAATVAAAIAAANLPVEGLSFDSERVLYHGLPFDQASSAEQLRVSLAIAAAKNSKLRVALIRDGSLLDSDSVKILEQFAAEHDLQVWREVVAEDAKSGIIIEDGRVASVQEDAA